MTYPYNPQGLLPRVLDGGSGTTVAVGGSCGGGTVTSIAAGTGITLSVNPIVTSGSVSLTVPVTVELGGTNSTTSLLGNRMMASLPVGGGSIAESPTITTDGNWLNVGAQTTLLNQPLMLTGADVDTTGVAGPYMTFTTAADAYPQLEVLPFGHDNVFLLFDSYMNGAGVIASSVSALSPNFRISKSSDALSVDYGSSLGASTAVTWNTGLTVDSTGSVIVGAGSLVKRPRLAVTGADSDPTGAFSPSITLTTAADIYPQLEILPFSHDNTQILYDSYYDSGNTVSSVGAATRNFRTIKYGSTYNIDSGVNTGVGTSVTWSTRLSVVGTTGETIIYDGLLFANSTPSYTPAALDYYEKATYSATIGGAISGSVDCKIVRVGDLVTMTVPAFTAVSGTTGSVTLGGAGTFPTRFEPQGTVTSFVVSITDSTTNWGLLTYDNSVNRWFFSPTNSGTGFTSGVNVGWSSDVNITYNCQ